LCLCVLLPLLATPAVLAQNRARSAGDMVLIKGARIITMAGPDLETGNVLIRNGKIMAVAPHMQVPRGMLVIEAAGMVVVPGLVDAHSALLSDFGGSGGGRAESRALDAVDVHRANEIEAALAQGVTAVGVFPPPQSGIAGRAAVLRLIPGATLEEMVLCDDAALTAALGLGPYGRPIARLKEIEGLEAVLKKAKEYKESFEEYEEELEEYLKKLEERAKKEEEEDKKEGGDKDKDKNGKKTAPADEPEKKADDKKADEKKGEEKNGKDKEDELKKPKKPGFSAANETIVRVLAGEIPLFVEVHRAADILNLLDVAAKYPVKLVLVGCTEGYKVTDALAGADVSVVLGPAVRETHLENSEFRNHVPGLAAALDKAGVPLVLASSGRRPAETRYLSLSAAQAVAHGLDSRKALAAVTVDAARMLGVADLIGTIEKGKDADLVVLSGHPFSSSAEVEMVFVKGKKVYARGE